MKNLFKFAALAAVCACAVAPAFADDYVTPTGVSVRIGGFYPSETDTRGNSGNSWLTAGIDFKLKGMKLPVLPRGYFSLSLDYAGKDDYRTAPLLLNYTSGRTLYWSAGAGVTFARFPEDDGTINDKVRFAYSGAIGMNFRNGEIPLFLEVRYFGCEMPRVAGVAVDVGARF